MDNIVVPCFFESQCTTIFLGSKANTRGNEWRCHILQYPAVMNDATAPSALFFSFIFIHVHTSAHRFFFSCYVLHSSIGLHRLCCGHTNEYHFLFYRISPSLRNAGVFHCIGHELRDSWQNLLYPCTFKPTKHCEYEKSS